jgi:hypothetical protein
MSKRSPKRSKRRSKALPALGLAGVSFSLASGACAATGEASANTPPASQSQSHQILLGEEEIFDVSLATFYVYDKENAGSSTLAQKLKLARGGCGGCGGCHGCGGGGAHIGCAGGGCRCGGIHVGCGGGCHFGCRGCRCGGVGIFLGGCLACGGCTASCWVWTPSLGWVYSCWGSSTPQGEPSRVVGSEQSGPTATQSAAKSDGKIAGRRTG